MSEEIRKDVLNASEKGKKKYQAFNSERIIDKTVQLRDTIHRGNLKTMISIKDKPKQTTKKVIRAMNITDKSIEVARDRGLCTDDLLAYDIVPSPMLFSDDGLMTKSEKSKLVLELEEHLKSGEYSFGFPHWCYGSSPQSTAIWTLKFLWFAFKVCRDKWGLSLWQMWLHLWQLQWQSISERYREVAEIQHNSSGSKLS